MRRWSWRGRDYKTGWPRTATGCLFALLVAGMGLLVTSILTASAGGGEVRRGGTLRLVYLQQPGTDPQNGEFGLLRATQLTLYSFADVGGDTSVRPAAAAGFPLVSADGRGVNVRGGRWPVPWSWSPTPPCWTSRLARLRATAAPIFRVAAMPRRATPSSRSLVNIVMRRPERFVPVL